MVWREEKEVRGIFLSLFTWGKKGISFGLP